MILRDFMVAKVLRGLNIRRIFKDFKAGDVSISVIKPVITITKSNLFQFYRM